MLPRQPGSGRTPVVLFVDDSQPEVAKLHLVLDDRMRADDQLRLALPLLAGENISARFVVPTVAASVDLVVHLGIDEHGVDFVQHGERRRLAARTVLWAAGVQVSGKEEDESDGELTVSVVDFSLGAKLMPTFGQVSPYVGAGLNYANMKVEVGGADASNSEVGLNLLGVVEVGATGVGEPPGRVS